MNVHHYFSFSFIFAVLLLTACDTTGQWQQNRQKRVAMDAQIKTEEAGADYWIGRRYYKSDYKFWGWVRRAGQPWSAAKLVMMNEQQKLAPDREAGHIGSDNGYEYKLIGDFSGQTVYEPASNGFYPEFVLKGYELRSVAPANIYNNSAAMDPARRVIIHPS
jgi:hypothetical protein